MNNKCIIIPLNYLCYTDERPTGLPVLNLIQEPGNTSNIIKIKWQEIKRDYYMIPKYLNKAMVYK